jgi:hypothetical protein
MLLCITKVRCLSYEFFLRTHQVFAVSGSFLLWWHLKNSQITTIYLLLGAGILCLTTTLLETAISLFRSISLRGLSARVEVVAFDEDFVTLNIMPSKLWTVAAGQYLNLTIPRAGFWFAFESHPFMVVSWTEVSLVLLIEIRTGFTQRLRMIAQSRVGNADKRNSILTRYMQAPAHFYPVYFSGPHGRTKDVDDYGTVLLVASDMGIAAQLPYLAQLIRNYNTGASRARRVHLIWELSHWSKQHPGAIEIADRLLREDIQDRAYVSSDVSLEKSSS